MATDEKEQQKLILIGGGGHASVILDLVDEINRKCSTDNRTGRIQLFTVIGCYDDNVPRIKSVQHLGTLAQMLVDSDFYCKHHVEYICCIGDNSVRKTIVGSFVNVHQWATLIHPTATVSAIASVSPGTVICAGAFVGPNARIGCHSIVNTHGSVDHDCLIGDYVHIAPGVHLCGNVHVGDLTLVGVGAQIIPDVHIGKRAIVGAGTTVLSDVLDGQTAVGIVQKKRISESSGKLCWLPMKIPDWHHIQSLLGPSLIKNHFANFGPCVAALEVELRKILDIDSCKAVIVVNNGTAALHAVVGALEIYNKSKLRFVTQAYTFPSSAQGNLRGVLIADVDQDGGLDIGFLEPTQLDGIIVTNLLGNVVQINKYVHWAEKHNKYIIFDNAATSFTLYDGM